jgi:drug/metabolite transporter (DMT)-like permease
MPSRTCPRCRAPSVTEWQAFRALQLRARFPCPACRAPLRQELGARAGGRHAAVLVGGGAGALVLASAYAHAHTPGQQALAALAGVALAGLVAAFGLAVARGELAASATVPDRPRGLLSSLTGLLALVPLLLLGLLGLRLARALPPRLLLAAVGVVLASAAYQALVLAAGWLLLARRAQGRAGTR